MNCRNKEFVARWAELSYWQGISRYRLCMGVEDGWIHEIDGERNGIDPTCIARGFWTGCSFSKEKLYDLQKLNWSQSVHFRILVIRLIHHSPAESLWLNESWKNLFIYGLFKFLHSFWYQWNRDLQNYFQQKKNFVPLRQCRAGCYRNIKVQSPCSMKITYFPTNQSEGRWWSV